MTTVLQIGIKDIDTIYTNWGAVGILLLLLVVYAWYAFKENIRRDKQMSEEHKEMIRYHKEEKEEMIQRYTTEVVTERQRYYELHIELLAFLKSYTHNHTHTHK